MACRVLSLCRLGRECPDLICAAVFSESERKSIRHIRHRGQAPRAPPALNEMIRLISRFGGDVLRPTTNPGRQTLWIGLQQLACCSLPGRLRTRLPKLLPILSSQKGMRYDEPGGRTSVSRGESVYRKPRGQPAVEGESAEIVDFAACR
ncbi:MAG: IS4 family transposase [Planctomycetaceae bacterium]